MYFLKILQNPSIKCNGFFLYNFSITAFMTMTYVTRVMHIFCLTFIGVFSLSVIWSDYSLTNCEKYFIIFCSFCWCHLIMYITSLPSEFYCRSCCLQFCFLVVVSFHICMLYCFIFPLLKQSLVLFYISIAHTISSALL